MRKAQQGRRNKLLLVPGECSELPVQTRGEFLLPGCEWCCLFLSLRSLTTH